MVLTTLEVVGFTAKLPMDLDKNAFFVQQICHLTGQFFLILRLFQTIQLRRDSEQALVKALKGALDFCVGMLTAVHL
jgi:hypothetical protein